MENNKKISFLSRMIFAITDFRIYPFIKKEKVTSAISYFLKLSLLITLIIAIYFFSNVYNVIDKVSEDYNAVVPNFVLNDGVLSAEERMEYSLENGIVIMDSNYTIEELKEKSKTTTIGYNYNLLISNNAANFYVDDFLVMSMEFANVIGNYTKATIYDNVIENLSMLNVKIYFFAALYISLIIIYIFWKTSSSILTAMILVVIINVLFGNRLKFSDEFKIAAYALTLPLILELIALLFTGTISESIVLIYQFLIGVYIFYALRAIKLDKIILAATRGGILKKIVNDGIAEDNGETKIEKNENNTDENKED